MNGGTAPDGITPDKTTLDWAKPPEDGAPPGGVIDCRGQRCPLPVIELARRLPMLPLGAVLRVLADDPAAAVDIPAWCRMRGHTYLGMGTDAGSPAFDVRRSV